VSMICPYCGAVAILQDSVVIYGRSFGNVYVCSNYPGCDAYCGVHRDTNKPLGTLANRALRTARKAAHAAFDPVWKLGRMRRSDAYAWLASELGIDAAQCHVALFNEVECSRVVDLMKEVITQ
jgi:hypothetical protein